MSNKLNAESHYWYYNYNILCTICLPPKTIWLSGSCGSPLSAAPVITLIKIGIISILHFPFHRKSTNLNFNFTTLIEPLGCLGLLIFWRNWLPSIAVQAILVCLYLSSICSQVKSLVTVWMLLWISTRLCVVNGNSLNGFLNCCHCY